MSFIEGKTIHELGAYIPLKQWSTLPEGFEQVWIYRALEEATKEQGMIG